MSNERKKTILSQVKSLAKEYYHLTQKPLGVTGEIAEYEAARLLNLELAEARQPEYDAINPKNGVKYQIKGRCIHSKKPGQRIGRIKPGKGYDYVLVVLLDQDYSATEIWQASREKVIHALKKPGSIARNVRGQLDLNKFKQIGEKVWPK
jgi:hypothetical protein